MSFPRYPKYKDSGVEWLGEVPAHWGVDRLKRSTRSCRNGIWGADPLGDDNDIACARVADFDRSGLRVVFVEPTVRNVTPNEQAGRLLSRGDLLLEKSGGGELQPVGFVVRYDDDRAAVCSNFVARIELATGMDSSYWRYLHHAAYSVRLNSRSIKQTSGIQNLDAQQYLDERAVFPPGAEQAAIAEFLDRETAKIDQLVEEQRRLIALLQEKRQAVISHAVTKGLNANAPMKPSGFEWLGDVPAHWGVMSVRRIVQSIEQGWSPECVGRPADAEEWGVVKSGCVNRGVFAERENKALPESLDPIPEYEIHVGDILMSRASGSPELVGSTAYVSAARPKLMLSDKIFRIEPQPSVDRQYFVAAFNSRAMRSQIERAISGADGLANNLPQSALKSFFFLVPPVDEQSTIVSFIASEASRLDTLTAEVEHAITLLLERRTALISAAVTGQIDVRSLEIAH